LSNGPLSSAVNVPARPKPGRKTAVDEPTSKRKAQNRQAQRNFRQRKLEHAHSLETNNQELRAENQQLLVEIDRLTHAANESQQQANRFRSELEEWQSRYNDIEGRWSSSLNAIARVQEQSRAAEDQSTNWRRRYEAKAVEVDMLERKLAMLQRQPSSFNSSTRIPPASQTSSPRPQSAHQSTPTPSGRPSSKRHATDGCGNCDETGDCPCVDSYIDASITAKETGDLALKKTSAMSIHSVLSPSNDRNIQTRSRSQTVADIVSDVSSENDGLETDFTTFPKNNVNSAAPLTSRPTAAPSSAVMNTEQCGFCTDDNNCLCTETTLGPPTASSKPSDLPPPPGQAALTSRPKPGSCLSCQSNPDQRAFCESLAIERAANRKTSNDNANGRHAKRPRLESNISIPCADAYPLFKRLSRSGENITYETLYNEYLKSQSGSRPGTGVLAEGEGKGREFSAFEADIGEVLASLHRYGSSISGVGSGGSEDAGVERGGNGDTMKSSGVRERVER
jgi:hypothetical protein